MIPAPAFPPLLAGHPVLHLPETASTNDELRARAARGSLAAGAVVVADRQTAGHGSHGRAWITLPERSLAVSVLLAAPAMARLSRLSVLAAVSVCRALQRLDVGDVRIKWPNDLMRGERKIGGLLLQTVESPSGAPLLVLGLGLNLELRAGDLTPELAPLVGDAGLSAERRVPLLAAVLTELDAALDDLGNPADAERGRDYCRRAWLPGRRVTLKAGGETLSACVQAMTPDGDLLLEGGRLVIGETARLLAVERAGAQPAESQALAGPARGPAPR